MDNRARTAELEYAACLARAFGGALLFAFPLLMTMEMWQLGHSIERWRLLVFVLATLPMLLGLSWVAGFEPTFRLKDELLDALAAFGVGVILSAIVLALMNELSAGMTGGEVLGRIAICSAPAAIGALLATKQFQARNEDAERATAAGGYPAELFIMLVGAVFLAFNVAPTEEVMLIALQMTPWHGLALATATLGVMHLLVFRLGFPGEDRRRGDLGPAAAFTFRTLPGYGIALLVSLFCLWVFGRASDLAPADLAMMLVVLGFPAGIGAATARLVV